MWERLVVDECDPTELRGTFVRSDIKKENQITEKLENVALVTHTRGPLY